MKRRNRQNSYERGGQVELAKAMGNVAKKGDKEINEGREEIKSIRRDIETSNKNVTNYKKGIEEQKSLIKKKEGFIKDIKKDLGGIYKTVQDAKKQKAKFADGGEVGKTYQIKGADVTFYEDSYEEGEQEQFHSYYLGENDFPYKTEFSSKKDLFDTLNDFVSYADMKEEDFYVDEDTIQTSALVKYKKDSDWDEFSAPTEKEIELWKEGKMKLYSAQFVFPYEVYKKEKLEFAKGGEISIEGNPYKNEDFFIYRNGKEVASWNVDEMEEDEDVEDLAKEMYDLYKKDKKELGKRLDRISYAKGGMTEHGLKKGDTIIDDLPDIDGGSVGVRTKDNKVAMVSLNKGERSRDYGDEYEKGGETEKGYLVHLYAGSYQFWSSSEDNIYLKTLVDAIEYAKKKMRKQRNHRSSTDKMWAVIKGEGQDIRITEDDVKDYYAKGGRLRGNYIANNSIYGSFNVISNYDYTKGTYRLEGFKTADGENFFQLIYRDESDKKDTILSQFYNENEAIKYFNKYKKRLEGHYKISDNDNKADYAKGGEVKKKENNEMLIGGLAGILLGIFLNK